jgi:16S rRNA C967 or C1407 C5-methylase (RsmB/RsmF family)/NOL1/NOP2/fmu family ribosome biogenesis protein
MRNNLPPSFVARMKDQLKTDFETFEAALASEPPVSIRINDQKKIPLQFQSTSTIPWCVGGLYLSERPSFTLDPAFHSGAYYVQEASSMLLATAFKTLFPASYPIRVLDLCAAPGGKSTLLASLLPEGSILVSNETVKNRIPVLKDNLLKWGRVNTWVTGYDPAVFAGMEGFFDLVVVDAPCSGEGLFRKDPESASHWSEEHVLHCAERQKRILAAAEKLISPGGALIYSTCTYNYPENEGNASWLENELKMQPVKMDSPAEWGITGTGLGYQCYPHRLKGEGFYISLFRKLTGKSAIIKPGRKNRKLGALSRKQQQEIARWVKNPDELIFYIDNNGSVMSIPENIEEEFQGLTFGLPAGVWCFEAGQFKGDSFLPSHALAQSLMVGQVPYIDLSKEASLHFLKKENILLENAEKGWLLIRYNGLGLGWVKNLGNRVNNYLPKEWRIRMEIE